MSTIELKWKDRIIGSAQTPRTFLDFVIDGESLYEILGDKISPLGWGIDVETQKAIDRFLLKAEPDCLNNRTSIYVCAECGDLGCGAVSAVIEKLEDQIIWRDFGYQNNYEAQVIFDDYTSIGPYSFNAEEYTKTIREATTQNS